MSYVHLEGMGLQGALLAHTLARYGVPFTWNDTDATICAWKASTGAIYPADSTNHGPDREAYNVWRSWYQHSYFDRNHLEQSGGLVFCTKKPPHGGKYAFQEIAPSLRLGEEPSFHLNAQTFVPAVRERFKDCRKPQGHAHDIRIVTHSWGERHHHSYWGWTRLVGLKTMRILQPSEHLRPAFYFRPTRFVMAYAYPVPGTEWYYAGSNIMKQAKGKEHELPLTPKYERWKKAFEECSQGLAHVRDEGPYLTGWRPAAADDDTAWVRRKGLTLTLRPLWNSGIRHFPMQWAGVAPQLGLIA
jgi:hypothetical protein